MQDPWIQEPWSEEPWNQETWNEETWSEKPGQWEWNPALQPDKTTQDEQKSCEPGSYDSVEGKRLFIQLIQGSFSNDVYNKSEWVGSQNVNFT